MTRWPTQTCAAAIAVVAACDLGEPAPFATAGDTAVATAETAAPADDAGGGRTRAPITPAPAGLRTLTPRQYEQSVRAVLGLGPPGSDDAPIPRLGAWASSAAAARGSLPPTTVVAYEHAARDIAQWAFADAVRRDALVGCAPTTAPDDACTRDFIARVGRRAYRRPLDDRELDRWAAVAAGVAAASDADHALELVLSGLLQSPHFVYRVELGTVDDPAEGRLRYTDHELATRLAYLLWSGPPDDALLDAAVRGDLRDPASVDATIDAMIADPRFARGVHAFLAELLQVDALLDLDKDPTTHPDFPAQRDALAEELVLTAQNAVLDGGFPAMFTTRTLHVSPETASLYGVYSTGLGPLTPTPAPATRAGVLTTPGLLAAHAYPGKTSPALRGLFVRKHLLCADIPPPPADVVTVLPERAAGELVTTRELVAVHQSVPSCAACHQLMDPIGLGLEHFDEVGAHRRTQHGLMIDASGELDGVPFLSAVELGRVVAGHDALLPCLASHLVAHANGATASPFHDDVEALVVDQGDAAAMLRALARADLFQLAWIPDPEANR